MSEFIRKQLFMLQDIGYKNFHSRLIPDIDADRIIGVRIPDIKKLAKKLKNEGNTADFIDLLPHYYYEENNLHAFIISDIKDIDILLSEIEKFLPYIDNWATCDSLRPKIFKKNTDKLLPFIFKWLESDHEFTVRFGIEMLMTYYLDEYFSFELALKVSEIKSDKYYINMMIAWYFATALSKQWESVIKILEENKLSPWVHNKTISKTRESYRITPEQKEYLKKLKVNL